MVWGGPSDVIYARLGVGRGYGMAGDWDYHTTLTPPTHATTNSPPTLREIFHVFFISRLNFASRLNVYLYIYLYVCVFEMKKISFFWWTFFSFTLRLAFTLWSLSPRASDPAVHSNILSLRKGKCPRNVISLHHHQGHLACPGIIFRCPAIWLWSG